MSWFSKKPPKNDATLAPNGPIMAVLLLKGDQFPYDSFAKLLAGEKICGRRIELTRAQERMYTFEPGDGIGAFAEMPGPYPWRDLEGPCATAWMWPKQTPAASVKAHKTFALVSLVGDTMAPIRRRLFLTQVVGMAARDPSVLGVYWPEGTLVHYPRLFSDFAAKLKTEEAPPLYLWVDYRVNRNADGSFGMFTTGMRALGLMELEIPRIQMKPGELREWAMNLTCYQLEKGPVLKDGETIGTTAKPEFRIRYRPSRFGHKGPIMAFDGL